MRIPAVCNRERISVTQLINNIDKIISKYDQFGSEAEFGNKSHRAVINALKRFKESLVVIFFQIHKRIELASFSTRFFVNIGYYLPLLS